ncbi:MAG TPA: hypothetical protein VF190_08010 [Rhodothermales bacterium]
MRLPSIVGLFVLVLSLAACDAQEQQDRFADEASALPKNFTETTIDGEVVTADPDDWRTSPVYRGHLTVDPAFPNPVSSTFVSISLTVTGFDAVRGGGLTLRAYGQDGRTLIALDETLFVTGPGAYDFRFSPGALVTKGLHRVFIFDLTGEIVSYGDVMVE